MVGALLIIFGATAVAGVATLWWLARSADRQVLRMSQRPGTSPEFLKGNDLFLWAKDTAERIVATYLGAGDRHDAASHLSGDVHSEATRAMFPPGVEFDPDVAQIPCPIEGQGTIGLTAPEAIEIAEYVQSHMSPEERKRIHDIAAENVQRLKSGKDPSGTPLPCPLQGKDSVCVVYSARPLRCRPLHAATVWSQRDVRRQVSQEADFDENVVEQGAETGLRAALERSGRDGKLYELNSALLVAMDHPDAGTRWMNGEDIFADCQTCK